MERSESQWKGRLGWIDQETQNVCQEDSVGEAVNEAKTQ